MGFETFISPADELRMRYRDQFPVTEQLVYLNHAAIAPLCRRSAEAMQSLASDACSFGSLHYDRWLEAYEGLRVAAAQLIQADRSEIAIVKNTSEGIATVALGFDWKPGDRIVAFREEFPANVFPWKRLEEKHGVVIEWLSCEAGLEEIARAVEGARLLTVSYVQYLSGRRVDLEALGGICAGTGTFFFVDAIQGLGAFPLDVRKARIHALAADGHKWMLGPEGCGILYIQRDQQDRIQPVEFGWTNIAGYNDYSCREMTLRPDAGRYECGTLNTIGCYGLRAAIEFLLEVGIPDIATAVTELTDLVARGVLARGYQILGSRTPENAAGIVSFRSDSLDSRLLVRRLKDKGFIAAPRQGWVRVSPHFYVSSEEIGNFLEALPVAG